MTATGTNSDGSTQDITKLVTWGSSDTSVATFSSDPASSGLVTGLGTGTAALTASFKGMSGTANLTVTAAVLTAIAVTPPVPSLAKGTTQQMKAIGTYSDKTTQDLTLQVTWSSSDLAVASFSTPGGIGLATGVDVGTATLTATLGAISGTATLTVTPVTLASIAVTPAAPSIAKGTAQQMTATGTYSDNTTQNLTNQVTWSSSDATVASFSSAGSNVLATGVGQGTATLTATLGAVSGLATLTVTPAALAAIKVTPGATSIAQGTAQQMTATGTYSDSTTQDLTNQVSWTSSDTSIATITSSSTANGLATGVAQGTVTFTATLGAIHGQTTLAVTPAILTAIAVTSATPSIAIGTTQQMTATGTYSDGTTQDLTSQVSWTSSDTSIATISSSSTPNGLVTAVALGSVTLTATSGSVSGLINLTVIPPPIFVGIILDPSGASVLQGGTLTVTAKDSYSDGTTQVHTGPVDWATDNPLIASVPSLPSGQGTSMVVVTGVAPGAVTLTATIGSIPYQTQVTVLPALP